MIASVEVRRGRYFDSVRLMQVSSELVQIPGVNEALVAMATDLNLQTLADLGFDPAQAEGAGPDDLLIAILADDDAELGAVERTLDGLLAARGAASAGEGHRAPAPRTTESAARAIGATVALVSVPGPHAFVEAMAALRTGLHVMVFSDNVPIDQEVQLKREAERRDLLVMGPDCGTSIIGGVGLGFANVVAPGPVGIAGASGTGIQQLCCLLDDAGVGVRHGLGTGSRDLSAQVGAASTLRSLAALDADPSIEVIVIVTKRPAPTVAERVREAAAACATPTVLVVLGAPDTTLEQAAVDAIGLLGRPPPSPTSWPASWPAPGAARIRPGTLHGLFSGGSLRDEAAAVVAAAPQPPDHRLIDLGADEYTRGRPHPMIDQRLRLEHLYRAATDPTTAAIMCDVVLGHGAHPDPAAELASAVGEAVDRDVSVIVSLCGSRHDPQGRDRQATVLQEAGASVWLSNAAAARHAAAMAGGGGP